MNHYEHNEQVALFRWAALQSMAYPVLDTMFAIPNSARRSPRQGAWMKAEGLRSGVWDIFLPVKRGATCGLFVEMKIAPNKPTPQQEKFRERVGNSYQFAVCYSWIDAKIAILDYLEGTKF